MDVWVQGKHRLSLTQADFKAQGGEGSVYVKGKTAYKIYSDPHKMISQAKMTELSALTLPEIICPQDVLWNAQKTPVGYSMRHVADALALCQVFPKAFRDRKGLTPDRMLHLVRVLQRGVAHVHAQGLLVVDLNEMNFLVDDALDTVYFIDVDSYQTPHFPATALMDSVRDRHALAFSPCTDWFSFAVVSFQMFVGIHPYKGKHPTLKTLEERMQANVSVFRKDVSTPAVCLPFDVIPLAYREWYRAVLDDGKRLPPPDHPHQIILVAPAALARSGSHYFHIEELHRFDADITQVFQGLAVTTQGVVLGGQTYLHGDVKLGVAGLNARPVAAWIEQGRLRLFDLHRKQPLAADIAANDVMACDGRLYVRQGASLREVDFWETPGTIGVSLKTVGQTLEHATRLFEGVAIQTLLGACYASILPRKGECHQVHLAELDGYQIVDARFQNGVLMALGVQKGRYDKFVFRFDAAFHSYDARRVSDVGMQGLNFTVLDTSICLHLTDTDALEVFSSRKGDSGLKVLTDPALQSDCKLFNNGTQALFARGRTLFKFTMKR